VSAPAKATAAITGQEHWTHKGPVRLFLWEKFRGTPQGEAGTIVFVHGSSMASEPTFERRKRLPELQRANRRPIDRAFVRSIFTRDHPGTADEAVVEAFADAILVRDDTVPTGTYVDMCANLPLVAPERITVPTLIMRGQYDGIAGFDDLLEFFKRLPNPDKQFVVMPGISHASFQQINYLMVYHILHSFFAQPEPIYRG
jgi:pimeloyl-ACP methyl ester carboxylesterase